MPRAIVAVLLLLAVPPAASASSDPHPSGAWRPPVPGAVARAFDPGRPFEAGRHRGVDLAAPSGAPVTAPCAGTVAFAGTAGANGGVVSLRCGPWRVTHLPLAAISVRAGVPVERGARLGTLAGSGRHAGLHLGVRRERSRFGYVDPLHFLAAPTTMPPLGPTPRAAPRGAPRAARPRRPPPPPRTTTPRPVPWPAWAGAALVLAAATAGIRLRARVRRPSYSNPIAAPRAR